jgi:hypothetical protein
MGRKSEWPGQKNTSSPALTHPIVNESTSNDLYQIETSKLRFLCAQACGPQSGMPEIWIKETPSRKLLLSQKQNIENAMGNSMRKNAEIGRFSTSSLFSQKLRHLSTYFNHVKGRMLPELG